MASARLRREVEGLRDAVTLLTRVRAGGRGGPADVAATYYPLVGAGVGVVVGLVLTVAAGVLAPLEAAALAVLVEVLLTGALHLDGLADCADGSAGRDPEHRLAIMRDHAVGVYGTVAVVASLGIRTAVLTALAVDGAPAWAVVALLAGLYALSRWSLLHPARVLGYPRAAGTGRGLVRSLGAGRAAAALVPLVLVLVGGVLALGAPAVVVFAGALVATRVVSTVVTVWARQRLGGATGDVLGACVEVSLVAALLVSSALRRVVG